MFGCMWRLGVCMFTGEMIGCRRTHFSPDIWLMRSVSLEWIKLDSWTIKNWTFVFWRSGTQTAPLEICRNCSIIMRLGQFVQGRPWKIDWNWLLTQKIGCMVRKVSIVWSWFSEISAEPWSDHDKAKLTGRWTARNNQENPTNKGSGMINGRKQWSRRQQLDL